MDESEKLHRYRVPFRYKVTFLVNEEVEAYSKDEAEILANKKLNARKHFDPVMDGEPDPDGMGPDWDDGPEDIEDLGEVGSEVAPETHPNQATLPFSKGSS